MGGKVLPYFGKKCGGIQLTTMRRSSLTSRRFLQEHAEEGYIFMQDNAPSHRSYETKMNLLRRQIPFIKFPPYSPDLNLIEHVWNWMKNWIQEHYWDANYRVDRIPLPQLKTVIW